MLFPRVPGPGARERLGDTVLRDVVERFHALSERQRKDDAFARRQLWDENFTDLVKALTRRVYSDAEVIRRMNTFVSVSINPAEDITKAVAVVYKRGVHRLLADATDAQESGWLELYAEGAAELQGLTWNRFAFLLGPVLVAPVVRNGVLVRETILPYQVELELDETGRRPVAALWAVRNGASYRRAPHNWREVSYVYHAGTRADAWAIRSRRGGRGARGSDGAGRGSSCGRALAAKARGRVPTPGATRSASASRCPLAGIARGRVARALEPEREDVGACASSECLDEGGPNPKGGVSIMLTFSTCLANIDNVQKTHPRIPGCGHPGVLLRCLRKPR